MNSSFPAARDLCSRMILLATVSLMAGVAMAQHMPIPGRMPGDVPYAHEYGTRAPVHPVIPVPPSPPPLTRPMRPPEQAEGYQPVRPAPPIGARSPERHAIPPERLPKVYVPSRGKLIDVPGPKILER